MLSTLMGKSRHPELRRFPPGGPHHITSHPLVGRGPTMETVGQQYGWVDAEESCNMKQPGRRAEPTLATMGSELTRLVLAGVGRTVL